MKIGVDRRQWLTVHDVLNVCGIPYNLHKQLVCNEVLHPQWPTGAIEPLFHHNEVRRYINKLPQGAFANAARQRLDLRSGVMRTIPRPRMRT